MAETCLFRLRARHERCFFMAWPIGYRQWQRATKLWREKSASPRYLPEWKSMLRQSKTKIRNISHIKCIKKFRSNGWERKYQKHSWSESSTYENKWPVGQATYAQPPNSERWPKLSDGRAAHRERTIWWQMLYIFYVLWFVINNGGAFFFFFQLIAVWYVFFVFKYQKKQYSPCSFGKRKSATCQ